MFFAARFDHWKRQDRILKILHHLHGRKCPLHLYFAGGIQSQSYYQKIRELVRKYDLADYVHFLGPIKQDDLKAYAYKAVANPSMYDMSNLSNVFYEIFSVGSVVIGLNDGSLDDYLIHAVNGFLVNDESEAATVIEELLRNKDGAQRIRANAAGCARRKFLSIDERFDREVDLIEQAVYPGRLS
ncbi:MAG: glycosyltransferase family 4 protein [Candidatus Thiosymbion ectosymbiont of Robbea hypermnestra]|nr:glycosyltransferase family 4 protein [Candidatus Thiosymbion ectosymbiont of Robbea hypermnestra]